MDTRAFLEAVWPAQGIFCLATPYLPPGATKPTYAHKVVTSIDEAMKFVNWKRDTDNLFFAIHTLKQPFIINPNKLDRKTGLMGGKEVRTHANMLEAKAFFFDLDIGEEAKKYQTREEALSGLQAFLFYTGLPDPLVTSSGGGYHVYWRITDPIASSVWQGHAAKLYHLARKLGLRVDPARTTDHSSVLRVVGTFNHKQGGKRPVAVVGAGAGAVTPTANFIAALDALVGDDELNIPTRVEAANDILGSNLDRGYDGPVPTLTEVTNVCEHVADFYLGAAAASNPEWYNIGAGVIQYVEDGVAQALELADEHPGREAHAVDDMARWAANFGPASCAKVDAACGGDACSRCPFKKLGPGPVAIALKVRKGHGPAPAQPMYLLPKHPTTVSVVMPAISPCPIPNRYARVVKGIQETRTPDPAKPPIHDILVPYDFWPYEAFNRTELEPAFSSWSAGIWLPNPTNQSPAPVEQISIKVTSPQLTDPKSLATHLSNHGLHIPAANILRVREYMLAYIRSLQEYARANPQYDHLGWADKARTQFVMPTYTLHLDGTRTPSTLSGLARPGMRWVKRKGNLGDQVQALDFYNEDRYLPHQFAIIAAAISPAFYGGTGYHGGILALVGESGGSKSTALAAGAAMWGDPEDYVMNITNRGLTVTARENRILTLANLPFMMDEMHKLDPADARAFALAATQPTIRERANPDGSLQPQRITIKSALTIVTSNRSLHQMIEGNDASDTAAAMRALEIKIDKVTDDPVEQAKANLFLDQLNQHHGHIGPEFLEFYITHRDFVDQQLRLGRDGVIRKFQMETAQRYWSAQIGSTLVGGGFLSDMKLVPFDVKRINEWVGDVLIPSNKTTINLSNSTKAPAVVLVNYLNSINGDILHSDQNLGSNFNGPRDLKAQWENSTGLVYVRRDAWKTWCIIQGIPHNDTLRTLHTKGIVVSVDRKHTIGAGTPLAMARTMCFVVNLKHPEIAAQAATIQPPATVTSIAAAKKATP